MEAYLATLAGSTLPLSPWLVGVLWILLFVATRSVALRSREVLATQAHVVVENLDALAALDRPGVAYPQFAWVTGVLAGAWFLGEPAFAFVAGGLVLMLAMTLGLNLHSLAFARRLADGSGATGSVTLSTPFVLEDLARRASTCALTFLIAGVLLAHSALLGAAMFLGLSAWEMSRRASASAATLPR